MKFPYFRYRKEMKSSTTQQERVFAEATELAHRRLEQCVTDLQARAAMTKDTPETARLATAEEIQRRFLST